MFSSPAALFSSLFFGAIGLGAFVYGRKMAQYKPMVIGVLMMVFPYFVPQTWLIYAIGCALCLGLYFSRG
jgi:drug/metabolite transporter (DMT)-like permease